MEDRSVLLFHGSPNRQNDYLWSDRPSRVFARVVSDQGDELMCFGNTHEAFHRLVGKSHFVAAGSVGCGTLDDMSAQYAVIDVDGSELMVNFRSVPYDHFRVEADMQTAGLSPLLLRMPPASRVALDAEADNLVEA
jgi:predicted phosphodiesterase